MAIFRANYFLDRALNDAHLSGHVLSKQDYQGNGRAIIMGI